MEEKSYTKEDFNLTGEEAPSEEILIPATPGKRVLAELADILLTLILSVILFGTVFANAFGTKGINKKLSFIASDLLDIQNESGLYIPNGSSGTLDLPGSGEYLIRSYLDDTQSEKDVVLLYYTVKSPIPKTVDEYYSDVLRLSSDTNVSVYFDPLVSGEYASLNSDSKALLTSYYGGSRLAEEVEVHGRLYQLFTTALTEARQDLVSNSTYMETLKPFAGLLLKRSFACSGASIVSYLLSSLVFFVLIPMIKKKGTTIGKKSFKIRVSREKGEPLSIPRILARGSVEMLEYMFVIPFAGFMLFSVDSITMPLMIAFGGVIRISVFLIIGLIVSVISLLMGLFRQDKRSFHDLVSDSYAHTDDYAIINAERAKRDALASQGERNDG